MLNNLFLYITLLTLSSGCASLAGQNFTVSKTSQGIQISEGQEKVLFYQIQPKSLNGKYERSNYIHPLYTLSGNVLTEDFPADHPHHHGIFWSWHQVIYNGKPIADGWISENMSWEVIKSKSRKKKNWVSLNNKVVWKSMIRDSMEPLVREVSSITVHVAKEDYRIIDFDIRLAALKDGLRIGGSDDVKGYGGFSWRFKLPDDIKFLNKDHEVKPKTIAVEAGPWLDFYGSFDGKNEPQSGVAVFCHPSNPGHPQPWILRAKRSMQNLAFPGRVPVELSKNGLRLKYRMVIHNEDVDLQEIETLFLAYSVQ